LLWIANLFGCASWLHGTREHREQIVATVSSPDGRWDARTSEITDSDGGFVTVVSDSVQLIHAGEQGSPVELMWIDTGGHRQARPKLVWTAQDTLRVTVPNLSEIGVKRREAERVHLDLRFDPPDPAARKAWLDKYFPGHHDDVP
jgi:hypothetical protein